MARPPLPVDDRFRLLAERSPDVIYRFRLHPSVGFDYVSPSISGLVGWTPEELYADPGLIYQMTFPDDLERAQQMMSGDLGVEDAEVLRWRRRDGTEVWTEQRITTIEEDGRIVAVEGTARDITQRIEAHERLCRSEAHLAAMLTSVDLIAVAIDLDGTITFANPRLCRLVGRREADLLGCNWFDTCVPPDERTVLRGRWALTAAALEPTVRFESGLLEASGAVRRISWSSAPIRDGAGMPAGRMALGDDVTATREAQALQRRLTAAVEQTAESVVITDTDGRIVYVNPAFERVSGYTREEVLGRNPRILQSGRQDARFYAEMRVRLSAGATWAGELVNRTKDGRLYVEEATITPIRDECGVTTSHVAVKRDVTREREMESNLDAAQVERLAVARILDALGPCDTPEATAATIVAAVSTLPDIDASWIVVFEPDGRAIVFAGSPEPFPGAFVGTEVPAARARELRAHAAEGPWAGPWSRRLGDPAFMDASLEAGITATASAPIGNGHGIVALLRTATTDAHGVARLRAHLPALAEVAAGVRPILEPVLQARWQAIATRARVLRILDERAFEPVFQPIVRLEDGAVVGFEALTRFGDGTPPELLFSQAAGVDLGPDLEVAALTAAIDAAGALPAGAWLSLNVSPNVMLAGRRLADALAARSRSTVLELTEHERVADYGALRSAIVALGPDIRIAVDDAGAGIANFSHLVELRPDFVKIDIGLVRGVNADLTRQALVVGLRHFATATGRDVIAEGIETEAERRTLKALGVGFGQGFLFGTPAPAAHWADTCQIGRQRSRGARDIPRRTAVPETHAD